MSDEDGSEEADTSGSSGTAGEAVYGQLLSQLLKEEEDTKTSLEQRGLAVVSSAGALVTLLVGIVGLGYRPGRVALPALARWFLVSSVMTFVIAGILGVLTNRPMGYKVFGQDALDKMVKPQYWYGPPEIGAWRVARFRVALIKNARQQNAKKARRLRQAIWAGGFGIIFAALSVTSLLFQRP